MNAYQLKQDCGHRITGSTVVLMLKVFAFRKHRRRDRRDQDQIRSFAPGGGIFCAPHTTSRRMCLENMVGHGQTGQEYGQYPIPQNFDKEFL